MVLVGLLVSEFQIRGPRDDIAKRVILVFIFGIIKYLCFVEFHICVLCIETWFKNFLEWSHCVL